MELKYGPSQLSFNVDKAQEVFRIKEPGKIITPDLFRERVLETLDRLKPDLSRPVIVVGDKTRLCGYPEYLPLLLDILIETGAPADRITLMIAYGTHLPQSDEECVNSYGPIYRRFPFIHHDCTETERFTRLGRTKRGTDVFIRQDVAEASCLLTFGAISHHYFAGYGGARKLIFPGLGYKPAIYQNHGLFLDGKAQTLASGCQAGHLDDNPLAEDLAEVESFRPADMAIHGILNSQGEVCDLLVGNGSEFFRHACELYGRNCETSDPRQFDLVVASCGGFPKDINFIQSHKAIHNAAVFVRDGGQLIVLAECRDDVGSKTFLPWLEMGSYQAAFETLSRNYEGNGGTALAMMEKLKRIRISLVTKIDQQTAALIGFKKIDPDQVQSLIAGIDGTTAVIPNASLLVKKI